MKRFFMLMAAAILPVAALHSQNLDPTVEVSRVYEGKLMEVHKPLMVMSVPDTVYRFDLEFDYSVFDNPYKGSYEFSPYMMQMRPAALDYSRNTLYLSAGAGYTLHPVLDFLWSPLRKSPFSIDVYASHKSYVGEYYALGGYEPWSGYDLISKAGVDMGYDWKNAALSFGASYYGVAEKDFMKKRQYDAVEALLSLKSKKPWARQFGYEVAAVYRFAEDKESHGVAYICEHNLGVDVSFGPRFSGNKRLIFDLGTDVDVCSGAIGVAMGGFYFLPHYVYEKGIMTLDAGIRVATAFTSGNVSEVRRQIVYPDATLKLSVIPDALRFYVHAGGGEKLNTYASLIAGNHHLDSRFSPGGHAPLMGVTVERISAIAGIEGRISNFFSYNLRGGYVNYGNRLFESAVENSAGRLLPAVLYSSCQSSFASMDWNLDTRNFRFDGMLKYEHVWGAENDVISPAAFTGDVSATYNWNGRIYAGVNAEFATSRKNMVVEVPWYVDLGVYAEYVINRKFSVWLRGGNLLNMKIQRNVLFAEKGVNFTAGICLNL